MNPIPNQVGSEEPLGVGHLHNYHPLVFRIPGIGGRLELFVKMKISMIINKI